MRRRWRRSAAVDAALGAASGLAASWLMAGAMELLGRLGSEETKRREKEAQGELEPATVRAAEAAAHVVGREVPPERRALAGSVVHYGYGALWGAGYALALRALGRSPLAAGLAFGAGLWLVSDEVAVPLLGFSRAPARYPVSTHAKGLAAHVVYGVATDAAWRGARAVLH